MASETERRPSPKADNVPTATFRVPSLNSFGIVAGELALCTLTIVLAQRFERSMLPFVPRKVAQKAVKTQVQPPRSQHTDDATRPEQIAGPSGVASSSNVVPEANTQNLATASLKGKGRETNASKPLLSADAFASLLCLSLSDHALWLDASLRRSLETSEEGCKWLYFWSKHAHSNEVNIQIFHSNIYCTIRPTCLPYRLRPAKPFL